MSTPTSPHFEPQLSQFELLESPPPSRPSSPLRVIAQVGSLIAVFVIGILAYAEVQADFEARKAREVRQEVLVQLKEIRAYLDAFESAVERFAAAGGVENITAKDRASAGVASAVAQLRMRLPTSQGRAGASALDSALGALILDADGLVEAQLSGTIDERGRAEARQRRRELLAQAERSFRAIEEDLTAATEPRRYRAWLIALLANTTILSTVIAVLGMRLYRRADLAAKALAEKHVALRRRELYVRSVVDAIPAVLFAQDSDGKIRLANRATAEIFGLPLERMVGGLQGQLSPRSEDLERFSEQIRQALETGEVTAGLRRVAHPVTDEERWFETRVVPLASPTGEGAHALVVGTDQTERVRAEQMIRASQLEILRKLAEVAEFRDNDAGQHTRRVARLGAEIARMLGLPDPEVELIEQAAPFHDIGKIGIPDSILLKPAPLTPREFEVMKTHTVIGAKLLSGRSSELLSMAERICLMHHERWDGSGYPSGLREDETPVAAQVVWVADMVDALGHSRRYRGAWPLEFIVAQLKIERGRKYGPAPVDACLELLTAKDGRERWIDPRPSMVSRKPRAGRLGMELPPVGSV